MLGMPPLALAAQRAHFDRAAKKLKLAEHPPSGKQRIKLWSFDVLNAFASHAYHMMMRTGVAVVARGFMQRSYFACLADVAEPFEGSMDGSKRDVGMLAANFVVDSIGSRVIARFEQRTHHGQALRRDRHPVAPAIGDELLEPPLRILAALADANQLNIAH
jgi:hypothetical protein